MTKAENKMANDNANKDQRNAGDSGIIPPSQICKVGLLLALACLSSQVHAQTNCYIYGMHDYNATISDLLTDGSEPRGWVLILQSLDGYTSGVNSDVVNAANDGLGVLVRLHWGYGTAGTLPPQSQYDTFASRAARLSSLPQSGRLGCRYETGNRATPAMLYALLPPVAFHATAAVASSPA